MNQTTSPTRKNSRSFPFAATTFALTGLALIAGLVKAPAAHAHVAIASGTVVANASQEVTFTVGHGCAGADTVKVRVEIPTGVTSVRPETSDFGKTSVEKDATGAITAVTWQKAEADVLEADTQYYKLLVRLKTPNTPFTTLLFPAHQTCRAADRTVSVVDWTALPTDPPPATGEAEP
ncbi:MAG TPA: DUF1775 domain-containing protein, partial [Polyangia bacterium]|nr:DUF1775 domain-containing protein [Polyangia bacterium]